MTRIVGGLDLPVRGPRPVALPYVRGSWPWRRLSLPFRFRSPLRVRLLVSTPWNARTSLVYVLQWNDTVGVFGYTSSDADAVIDVNPQITLLPKYGIPATLRMR